MDIFQYLKDLFDKSNNSSSSQPLIHELIERTEREQTAYDIWRSSSTRRQVINWLIAEYSSYKNNPQNIDPALEFMDRRAQGFVIHYHEDYTQEDFQHLMDYLKERTLEIGYRSYMSDVRSYQKEEWVETVQRHYLKPLPQRATKEPINQQFGNITIELVFKNDQTTHLKLMALGYSDHLYQKSRDFKEYMFHLNEI